MADYTDSRPGLGATFPINGVDSSWSRVEPLLTPADLKFGFLFGIPLVSGIKNPVTKRADVIDDPQLAKFIDRAVAIAEVEAHISIFPISFNEKHPFDPQEHRSHMYMRLLNRPVISIEKITVQTADGQDVYTIPQAWIETANLHQGQVNVIPVTISMGTGTMEIPTSIPAGSMFLQFIGYQSWVPAMFRVEYTAGFPDGSVPKVINELIGTIAAMEVLSVLAPTYGKSSGSSLSIDGMSQSVSTPGPELFNLRMQELDAKRKMLVKKIKSLLGMTLFSGNV